MADLLGRQIADVDIVDQDLALLDVIIAPDQVEDGRLARAGGADEGDLFPRVDDKAHVAQNVLLSFVGEPDVAELDLAAHRRQLDRMLRLEDRVLFVEDGEDLFRRGHGVLQRGKLLSQFLNGLKEGADIVGENVHRTERYRSGQHAHAAAVEDQGERKRRDAGKARPEHHEDQQLAHLGAVEVGRSLFKLRKLFALARKDLDELHAGDVFGQEGVERGDLRAHDAVHAAHQRAERQRDDENHRQEQKREQREAHVDAEHHDRVADDEHRVRKQAHEHARIHLVERLHVVRHARHDAAHGVGVEKAERQRVDVLKHLLTDGEDNALSGLLQQPDLAEMADDRHQQHGKICDRRAHDALIVLCAQRHQIGALQQRAAVLPVRQRDRDDAA